jgi:uncharacterized protein
VSAIRKELRLSLLIGHMSVCRLNPAAEIQDWAMASGFLSITRTEDELSVVCPEEAVPEDARSEDGWRVLRLEGPFEFSEVGVLSSVVGPLAEADVSVFAVSTYDTDYVLVKAEQLEAAVSALRARGHEVL